MSIADKLMHLADAELAVLQANAARLQQIGTPMQKRDAQGLMPAIEAELSLRRKRRETAVGAGGRASDARRSARTRVECEGARARRLPPTRREQEMRTDAGGQMHAHRFAIGQIVDFSPGLGEAAARRGNYEVVRLLPADAHNNQYRIKSVNDGHERVAKESQLAV